MIPLVGFFELLLAFPSSADEETPGASGLSAGGLDFCGGRIVGGILAVSVTTAEDVVGCPNFLIQFPTSTLFISDSAGLKAGKDA